MHPPNAFTAMIWIDSGAICNRSPKSNSALSITVKKLPLAITHLLPGTPGHAVHHIAWQLGDTLFTGDVAGVCIENVLVQPPCPPPDIHLEDWEKSIALIKTLDVKRLLLTHFGEITDIDNHLSALQERIWKWANWIKPHWEAGESPQDVTPSFMDFTNAELLNIGATEAHLAQYDAANPAWMSVAGLMRYWHKREEQ